MLLLEEGLAGMAPSVAAAIVKEAGRVQEDGQAQVGHNLTLDGS